MSFELHRGQNQWRQDPVTNRWCVVTTNRRFLAAPEPPARGACLFCERTELPSLHAEQGVVVLPANTPLCAVEDAPPPSAPFEHTGALGAHELVVPLGAHQHDVTLATAPTAAVAGICRLFARRVLELRRDPRLRRIALSVAPGQARLPHFHAAVLAAPQAAPCADPAACPICADLAAAGAQGRQVQADADWVVWVPYAPQSPVHIRLAPRVHGQLFALLGKLDQAPAHAQTLANGATALAARIGAVSAAVARLIPDAALQLRVAPLALRAEADGKAPHLLIELTLARPVDAALSGAFEVGVCPLAPESLAQTLKEALAGPES